MLQRSVSNGNYITEVEQDISEGRKLGDRYTNLYAGYRINWNSVHQS